MLAAQEKHGHLAARDEALGTVVAAPAPGRDSLARDLLDGVVEEVALRNVVVVREPPGLERRDRRVRIGEDDVLDRSRGDGGHRGVDRRPARVGQPRRGAGADLERRAGLHAIALDGDPRAAGGGTRRGRERRDLGRRRRQSRQGLRRGRAGGEKAGRAQNGEEHRARKFRGLTHPLTSMPQGAKRGVFRGARREIGRQEVRSVYVGCGTHDTRHSAGDGEPRAPAASRLPERRGGSGAGPAVPFPPRPSRGRELHVARESSKRRTTARSAIRRVPRAACFYDIDSFWRSARDAMTVFGG